MLGVCLLFVGIVLINNGMCTLYKVDGKSAAVMNLLTGGLSVFINFVSLVQGNYYAAGTCLDLPICLSHSARFTSSARFRLHGFPPLLQSMH